MHGNDPPDLSIICEINGETTRQVLEVLRRSKGQPVHIEINSGGGYAFEGMACFNAIRRHGQVTCTVIGLAASAAGTIALGCTKIRMCRHSMMMHHMGSSLTFGGAAEHRHAAAQMEKLDNLHVQMVASLTGHPEERIRSWLEDETWLTPQEAVDLNFADEVIQSDHADFAPVAKSQRELLSKFRHVPTDLKAIVEGMAQGDPNTQPAKMA